MLCRKLRPPGSCARRVVEVKQRSRMILQLDPEFGRAANKLCDPAHFYISWLQPEC